MFTTMRDVQSVVGGSVLNWGRYCDVKKEVGLESEKSVYIFLVMEPLISYL